MNVEQLERAQALGFGSVAEMESHEAWLAKTAGPDYLNWVERVKRANGEPAEWQVPCLFECDPITLEATGTVATFCSTVCRSKSMGSIGFAAMAPDRKSVV